MLSSCIECYFLIPFLSFWFALVFGESHLQQLPEVGMQKYRYLDYGFSPLLLLFSFQSSSNLPLNPIIFFFSVLTFKSFCYSLIHSPTHLSVCPSVHPSIFDFLREDSSVYPWPLSAGIKGVCYHCFSPSVLFFELRILSVQVMGTEHRALHTLAEYSTLKAYYL